MEERGAWWHWVGGAVLLAWCLLAAVSALLTAIRQPRDSMAELEASFKPLAFELPPSGKVGYLQRHDGVGDFDVRTHYAAQYALVPRVVEVRTGQEFLIAASGTDRPGGDERINGYHLVTTLPSGHRLFRRLAP